MVLQEVITNHPGGDMNVWGNFYEKVEIVWSELNLCADWPVDLDTSLNITLRIKIIYIW